MFGTSIPINMFKSFAAIFYVTQLGLPMKAYSSVLFIYTFVDAIDNPVYGFLSDRTSTRWGRRRPWLVIGTPLLVLAFILFFNVPSAISGDSGRLYVYMLLTYILTGTLDSLINANYGALFPELFKADKDRARVNAIRQCFQLLAMVISMALTPTIADKIGYQLTSVIYGVLALAMMMYSFLGCHEEPEELHRVKPNLLRSIVDLALNGHFWIYAGAAAFYSAAASLIMQAFSFFVKYSLKQTGTATTILLGTVLGVAVIGILVWSAVAKKVDVIKIWRAGFIIMLLGLIPLAFSNTLLSAACIASIVGFGMAAVMMTMDVIGAKIIDDDYQRHGIHREGVITSLMGVMNRMNGLYTSLAFYVVSEVYGFVNGDNPGTNPNMASRMLLCVFPAIAMAAAVLFSFLLHFNMKGVPDGQVSDSKRG